MFCHLPILYDTGVVDRDPALPESVLGERLWAGGRERAGEGEVGSSLLGWMGNVA